MESQDWWSYCTNWWFSEERFARIHSLGCCGICLDCKMGTHNQGTVRGGHPYSYRRPHFRPALLNAKIGREDQLPAGGTWQGRQTYPWVASRRQLMNLTLRSTSNCQLDSTSSKPWLNVWFGRVDIMPQLPMIAQHPMTKLMMWRGCRITWPIRWRYLPIKWKGKPCKWDPSCFDPSTSWKHGCGPISSMETWALLWITCSCWSWWAQPSRIFCLIWQLPRPSMLQSRRP